MTKENPTFATQQQLEEIHGLVASEMERLVPDDLGTENPYTYAFTDEEEKHLSGTLTRNEVEAIEPSAPDVLHIQEEHLHIEYIASLDQEAMPPSVHFEAPQTNDPVTASIQWDVYQEDLQQYSGIRSVTASEAHRQPGNYANLLQEMNKPQLIRFEEADALLAVARHLRRLEQFTDPQT